MISGVKKREAEKEVWDRHKTVRLQDDEIERLQGDLETVSRHIAEVNDHNAQAVAIHRQRVAELKSLLLSIPTQLSKKKTRLTSSHTRAINSLRDVHREKLDKVRREYEKKLKNLENNSSEQNRAEEERLDGSIVTAKTKLGEVMRAEIEKKEKKTQERLQKITSQIETDRKRSKTLRKEIDKLKLELERAKALAESKTTQLRVAIPDIDTQRIEENLLFEKANMVSEENCFRQESHAELEKLRNEICSVNSRIAQLKRKIRESETDDGKALKYAREDLEKLEQQHYDLTTGRKKRAEETATEYKSAMHRTRKFAREIEAVAGTLRDVQYENIALLTELKRLDFMVYGRKGKYQTKIPTPVNLFM